MSSSPIVESYVIDGLKRKARAACLQTDRAAPTLEAQPKSLAELYEPDIDRLMRLQYAITAAASISLRAIRLER